MMAMGLFTIIVSIPFDILKEIKKVAGEIKKLLE